MAIDACPECQSLWDEYRECVFQIRQLRGTAAMAMHSHDHQRAKTLQVELDSLEQKSVDVRHVLMEHQRTIHSHRYPKPHGPRPSI
jgi:hypothetical protein